MMEMVAHVGKVYYHVLFQQEIAKFWDKLIRSVAY